MEVKTLKITSLESVYIMPKIFCMDHYNTSLSNSNHFMLAKICQPKSCIIDFMLAKMEFALAIFKKLYFSKHSIKRCSKICLTIQIGLQWGNDKKIKHYFKEIIAGKKKTCSKFSEVYYLQICIRYYTFCYYHCQLFGFNQTTICRARLLPNQKKIQTILLHQIKQKYILYYYTTIPIKSRFYH